MIDVELAEGLVLEDDWYAVEALDGETFAIGEPDYYQQNWSYLFVGESASLLFDTGSFYGDITGVVGRRAKGPLTAFPSHMHFDHLGNVTRFETVALADLDMLRRMAPGDVMTPEEAVFLGAWEERAAPRFKVARWLEIGSEIDLGGRRLEVLHTPGHSPDSVSLYEAAAKRLYAADFLYGGDLYGQVPGASLPAYLEAAEALAGRLPEDVAIYCAHGNVEEGGVHAAPVLGYADLTDLVAGLRAVREACRDWDDAKEWRHDINGRMGLLIGPDAIREWRG
jgi:hydroxyacylglutathione hydrolase